MEQSLYNREVKEKYLEKFDNEQTKTTIGSLFQKAELIEEALGKDLYNFNSVEIGKVIQNARPVSGSVAFTYQRFISKYISWAISPMAIRDNNINPLKGLTKEWSSQFVDHTKKIHWSKDELYEFLELLPNAQDQAMLALMFEGVIGDKLSEIINLHYKDIDWNNNKININSTDDSKRTIEVENRTMRFIENAYKEITHRYYDEKTGDYKESELVPTDFIFKNANTKRNLNVKRPINKSTIYLRLKRLKDEFELEYLTANSLKESGMIHMITKIFEAKEDDDKVITKEDLFLIAEEFGFKKMKANGYEYYNTSFMKTILSPEKVYKTTNVKIKYK
ncbi:site-specific integrase [Cytobacillus kochii]|uniref:phage lytic cycle repressor MrpR family protein n=1 Tax=Cytobacillus kochii TaxID=859143 RepID=UPI001CD3AAC2|nr:tyrosine-type recombinase/integrase [Cytobacillus kochii]MCA1027002.1 site-specific integrase [Cytobacillus kochii]